MKSPSIPNRFNSNSHVLLGFLGVLLSCGVLVAGLGAISKTFAARIGSPHAVLSNSSVLSSKNDVASEPGTAHRLDEQGNRPQGISFQPLPPRNSRAIRPTGNGNWFSLGPPGGDVFDAAVSTADPGIVLISGWQVQRQQSGGARTLGRAGTRSTRLVNRIK